jgi:hypothetical protein
VKAKVEADVSVPKLTIPPTEGSEPKAKEDEVMYEFATLARRLEALEK